MSEIAPTARPLCDAWVMADALGKILCDAASLLNTADCDRTALPPAAIYKIKVAADATRQLLADLESGYYGAAR